MSQVSGDQRIALPDICLTGHTCYDMPKMRYQEGIIYGSTKQEERNPWAIELKDS